ncbi:hypothetical protein GGX14DRAFT_632691 [Mycena pura]|uniref:Uncharacterized protein n=1 Tax=Mycena pura TaxID=153505 RepID=A0AAD6VJI5_9AGAR|nr:hypothetical protein GGX14DRAFT_632691 [Mycena pura]
MSHVALTPLYRLFIGICYAAASHIRTHSAMENNITIDATNASEVLKKAGGFSGPTRRAMQRRNTDLAVLLNPTANLHLLQGMLAIIRLPNTDRPKFSRGYEFKHLMQVFGVDTLHQVFIRTPAPTVYRQRLKHNIHVANAIAKSVQKVYTCSMLNAICFCFLFLLLDPDIKKRGCINRTASEGDMCGALFGNRRHLQPITSVIQTLVFWYSGTLQYRTEIECKPNPYPSKNIKCAAMGAARAPRPPRARKYHRRARSAPEQAAQGDHARARGGVGLVALRLSSAWGLCTAHALRPPPPRRAPRVTRRLLGCTAHALRPPPLRRAPRAPSLRTFEPAALAHDLSAPPARSSLCVRRRGVHRAHHRCALSSPRRLHVISLRRLLAPRSASAAAACTTRAIAARSRVSSARRSRAFERAALPRDLPALPARSPPHSASSAAACSMRVMRHRCALSTMARAVHTHALRPPPPRAPRAPSLRAFARRSRSEGGNNSGAFSGRNTVMTGLNDTNIHLAWPDQYLALSAVPEVPYGTIVTDEVRCCSDTRQAVAGTEQPKALDERGEGAGVGIDERRKMKAQSPEVVL